MKIELAVYTAVTGYDWQPGSVYDKRQLDGYLKMLRANGSQNNPFAKIFLYEDRVVFARYFVVEGIERQNRRASYIILGTLDAASAVEVNFMDLLYQSEVAQPVPPPFPSVMEYKGSEAKKDFNYEKKNSRYRASDLLPSLGSLVQNAESLFIEVTEEGGELYSSIITCKLKPKKPTYSLAQKMIVQESVLRSVFSLFQECGDTYVYECCCGLYPEDSVPSEQLENRIRDIIIKARDEIRSLRSHSSEVDIQLSRFRKTVCDLNDALSIEKSNCFRLNKELLNARAKIEKLESDLSREYNKDRNSESDLGAGHIQGKVFENIQEEKSSNKDSDNKTGANKLNSRKQSICNPKKRRGKFMILIMVSFLLVSIIFLSWLFLRNG